MVFERWLKWCKQLIWWYRYKFTEGIHLCTANLDVEEIQGPGIIRE